MVVIGVFAIIVVHVVLGASLCSPCSLWEPGLHFLIDGCNNNQEGTTRTFVFLGWGEVGEWVSMPIRRELMSCPIGIPPKHLRKEPCAVEHPIRGLVAPAWIRKGPGSASGG